MRRWRFLAVISAAQLALLLAHLGRDSLWLDEVTSADVAGAPWGRVWAFFRSLPEQHPLYYLLLRGWTILGTSEATLRSLSVVLAIATVWALYALVERVAGERTARVAAVIAAASPYFLYYGQEARMYALLAFLTVANGYWFLVWQDTGARRPLALYLASAVCGVYTHLFFWWVLLAQLVFVILRDWPVRAAWRKTVGAQLAVAIAYSPWVLLLATHRPEPQAWKGPATIVFGIPYTLLRFSLGYSEFLANAGWKNRVPELVAGNAVLLVVALVVFGVLAVVGWRELWRAGRGRDGRFVLCGLVVPMAAALLASLVVVVMGERYLMVSFPFYVTLLAAGVVALWRGDGGRRPLGIAVLALYGLLLGRALVDYYADPAFGKEQWADVARFVRANERRGDVIVVHSGFVLRAFTRYYGTAVDDPVRSSDDVSVAQLQGTERLWLVLAHTDPGDEYWKALTPSHQIVLDRLYPHQSGIRVMCLSRRIERPT